MDRLILYSYFRSSAAYRVRIALNLKQLDYGTHAIHLVNNGGENWHADYLAINPQGLLPALDVGADNVLFQSQAIIEYLDEKYPEPRLLPAALDERAFVRGLAQIISCDIHPLNNLRLLKYLKDEFNGTEEKIESWYCHWMTEGFNAFEKQLAKRSHPSNYCCGEQPSVADIFLIPQMYNARRFNCDVTNLPIIQGIEKNCLSLKAFQDAAPEVQADAH